MAGVVVEGGANDCPVIQAWLQLEGVVERASKGHIALCRTDGINRQTVADNHELLKPLLQHFGTYAAHNRNMQCMKIVPVYMHVYA